MLFRKQSLQFELHSQPLGQTTSVSFVDSRYNLFYNCASFFLYASYYYGSESLDT